MSLHEEVHLLLSAFCEGNGVCEQDGEMEISLGHIPIWVRVHESPAAIQVYREVADDVPQTSALNVRLHDLNHSLVVHRVVWEDQKFSCAPIFRRIP